jgi:hypothetical protein
MEYPIVIGKQRIRKYVGEEQNAEGGGKPGDSAFAQPLRE